MADILTKTGLWRQTQGEGHVKRKAGMELMPLQAQGCQRLPTNPQKPGERLGIDSHSQPLEGTNLPTS